MSRVRMVGRLRITPRHRAVECHSLPRWQSMLAHSLCTCVPVHTRRILFPSPWPDHSLPRCSLMVRQCTLKYSPHPPPGPGHSLTHLSRYYTTVASTLHNLSYQGTSVITPAGRTGGAVGGDEDEGVAPPAPGVRVGRDQHRARLRLRAPGGCQGNVRGVSGGARGLPGGVRYQVEVTREGKTAYQPARIHCHGDGLHSFPCRLDLS